MQNGPEKSQMISPTRLPKIPSLDRLILFFIPTLSIEKRAWRDLWSSRQGDQDRKAILQFSSLIFVLFTVSSIPIFTHSDLEPKWFWMVAKAGTATVFLSVALISAFTSRVQLRGLKMIFFAASVYLLYFQGHSLDFRPQTPFFYVPLFAGFCSLVLRENLLFTHLAFFVLLAVGRLSITQVHVEALHSASVSSVALFLLTYMKMRVADEIRIFTLEQKGIENQKALIEAQTELNDQIGSFLPREIYRRVMRDMATGVSPHTAIENQLRPTEVTGAVLFTDIRGFTRLTKLGPKALLKTVIPAQKTCTDIIEEFSGIPRLQGDLVFAYFDSQNAAENILRAIASSMEIDLQTRKLNAESEVEAVKRYMIISFGDVLVGNLGGTNGSRDISVLGDAANIPSRIDAATKIEPLASALNVPHLILTESAVKAIPGEVIQFLEYTRFDLMEHHLTLRDFETERYLYLVKTDRFALEVIKRSLTHYSPNVEKDHERGVA